MNGEEKLFDLMSKMYADLKSSQEQMYADLKSSQEKMYTEMTEGFTTVNERLDKVENEVKKTNNVIENEIKPKMEALFDGHVQNTSKIDRIEAEVIKHDEFILKRVR